MAAVMSERNTTQWNDATRRLEPEGRGHELLLLWGLHRRGGERVKSAVASMGWSEQLDRATEDEPPSVVAVDRVLAGLYRSGHEHAVDITKRFYLEHPSLDYWQVAQKVYRTEGFVRLTLRGVAELVDARVSD
jgi:hypothetical protein